MSERRKKLLDDFIDAARALAAEGMSGLEPRKALIVDAAQKAGADLCLVYVLATDFVIGALNLPNPDSDPVTIFRIETEEVSH